MNKKFPFLLVALLTVLFSCTDDPIEPEPEVIDLNNHHIFFKLNGEETSLVPNGVSIGGFFSNSGSIATYGGPGLVGVMDAGAGFETETERMAISKRFSYVSGDYIDDFSAGMSEEFASGSYNYKEEYSGLGMELEYLSNSLGLLTTRTGDQTGSSFIITEIVSINDIGERDITIKGTFSCKLYNDALVSYTVTEGTYYVQFEL